MHGLSYITSLVISSPTYISIKYQFIILPKKQGKVNHYFLHKERHKKKELDIEKSCTKISVDFCTTLLFIFMFWAAFPLFLLNYHDLPTVIV